jgi:hypothetical protein
MNRNFLAIWLGLRRELLRSIFAADLAALSDWPRPATQWEASVHAIVPWARGLLLAQSGHGDDRVLAAGGVCPREWRQDDLRAVTKKCRTDWDITTPNLNEAWQQGRKELFYPYGKTYVQTLGEQI